MRRVATVLLLTLVLPFCKHADGYTTDVQTICDGPNLPVVKSVSGGMDPSQLNREIREEVTKRLTTPQGKALLTTLYGPGRPADRAAQLRAEASRLGIASCSYADLLQKW